MPATGPLSIAMPLAAPGALVGFFGKLPAHGDFVRRGLPAGFCSAWDTWLRRGLAEAGERLGEEALPALWQAAPAWRFALPAHACGPLPVAGVMLPSTDAVGRWFPLTVACLGGGSGPSPGWQAGWFAAVEGLALMARDEGLDADALAPRLPLPDESGGPSVSARGWWTADGAEAPGLVWPLPALPSPAEFVLLLERVA